MAGKAGRDLVDKVLKGVLKYRQNDKLQMMEELARASAGHTPTALFLGCMDNRILPYKVMQIHDGSTVFIVRNPGNMVPHAGVQAGFATEPAALQLACLQAGVHHVVICGHSDCKAMATLYKYKDGIPADDNLPLNKYLHNYGHSSLLKLDLATKQQQTLTFIPDIESQRFEAVIDPDHKLGFLDKLSQINCLQQVENVASHPFLRPPLVAGTLHLHAMWFCLRTAEMFYFSKEHKDFVPLDEEVVEKILAL